jgi:hypothetical protein
MFNPPPADLNDREPLIYSAAPAEFWYRSYRVGNSPIFFGKSRTNRWDSPDGDFGVVYLGADEHCAFMESIGRGVLKTRFVPSSQLRERALAKIRFRETLRLIDMVTSGGLTRLGTESSLASGSGYKNSQRWSRALREHPSKPDGLYYRSRHDPARTACGLFDHCARSVEVVAELGSWADQPALLGEILDHYAFGTDLEYSYSR